MTTASTEHPWADIDRGEALGDGGTELLDLVSAVDYLRRGIRPGFNVYDAIEEALRWWTTERRSRDTGAPDPDDVWQCDDPLLETLRCALQMVDGHTDLAVSEAIQQAIRHWTTTMAERFNAGHHWPHPAPRHDVSPVLLGNDDLG